MARLTSAASVLISDDVSFFMCRHSNLALGFAQAFSFTISSRKPDGLTRRRRQQPLAVASPLSRVAPLVGGASAFIVRCLAVASCVLFFTAEFRQQIKPIAVTYFTFMLWSIHHYRITSIALHAVDPREDFSLYSSAVRTVALKDAVPCEQDSIGSTTTPNQSPEPTRIIAVSCPQGFQWFHIAGSGWLSFFR